MCDGFTRANVSADRPSGDGLRALPYWMEENAGDVNHGAGGVITSVKDIVSLESGGGGPVATCNLT